ILALEQQPRPRVFRHGVGETVAEVELSGVSLSLAVASESRERRARFLVCDRLNPHSQLEKFAGILLGLLDARMPLSTDPQGRLEERDQRGNRSSRFLECVREVVRLRFTGETGNDSGGIDKHYRFPLSSS